MVVLSLGGGKVLGKQGVLGKLRGEVASGEQL